MEELGCHVAVGFLLVGIDLTGKWCTKKPVGLFTVRLVIEVTRLLPSVLKGWRKGQGCAAWEAKDTLEQVPLFTVSSYHACSVGNF